MFLVVLLAVIIAAGGSFVAGAIFGLTVARARRDADRIAPHEALRPLYEPAALRLGPGRP